MLLGKGSFWLLIVTICVVMSIAKADEDDEDKDPKCRGFDDLVPIDDDTVIALSKKKWYFPLMMKIPLSYPQLNYGIALFDMRLKKRLCADVEAKDEVGSMTMGATAAYNEANRFQATVIGKQMTVLGEITRVALIGELSVVQADKDYDYLLHVLCLNGDIPYWFVVSPHKTLRANQEKKIKEKLKSLGYDPDDIEDRSDHLKPLELRIVDC